MISCDTPRIRNSGSRQLVGSRLDAAGNYSAILDVGWDVHPIRRRLIERGEGKNNCD
jgi:hypothetical protein